MNRVQALLGVFAGLLIIAVPGFSQGTAFTYQGNLFSSNGPANGLYELSFALYPTNIGGIPSAGPITNLNVPVINGLFTVGLDFGENVFTGSNYWLEIAVQSSSDGGFTTLTPRQSITPAPYAIFASNAGTASAVSPTGTIPLTALPSNVVQNGESGINSFGSFVNDTRPLANADEKGVFISAGTPYQLMTNNGPCTLKCIRIDAVGISGPPDSFFVSVYADGASNGFSLKSFLCAQFQPPKFHGEVIDLDVSSTTQVMGERLVNINAYTNAGVCVNSLTQEAAVWSDVSYKMGIPVGPAQQRVWHAVEMSDLLGSGAVNQTVSYSGGIGQVESVVGCILSTNGQYYLEGMPTFVLDGVPWYRNGTEDFFGGALYWDMGTDNYANGKDGSECESALQGIPGPWTDGNSSYVFFDGMTFSNSMSFSYPNVTPNSLSNIWLITYWTAH